jgi:RNA polymerase sigma factor (sigma-70 family)
VAAVQSIARTDRLAELTAAEVAARLYEAYHQRVLRYCHACLRSREEAEDAAQTTFLYAFRALERGITPQVEIAWLLAIARNVCMARHRAGGRRRERETLQDPVVLQDVSAAPEPFDGLTGIEEALARLPESQRQAILLREWRGFSYREIAEELGLSGAAVETLIFRARRSLAEQLDPERAQERRRVLRGLDVGSAAAALKSLLGAGAAAKVAVVAATVATVATVISGAIPGTQASAPLQPATRQLSPAAEVREHVDVEAKGAARAAAANAPKTKHKPTRPDKQPTGPVQSGGAGPADVVEDAVGRAGGAAGQVAPELPYPELTPLPDVDVKLPDLDVELPPALELSTPELPLP